MEFFNGAKLDDFADQDVNVVVLGKSEICDVVFCKSFMLGDRLCVDLIPELNRKYVAEVPNDAYFSRQDEELCLVRYGIMVSEQSSLGQDIKDVIKMKKEGFGE